MDNHTLRDYIKQVSNRITEHDLALLVAWAVARELKKGEALLKEGEICRSFYLVQKGYLRTWYNKEGVEINLNFTLEAGFTTNLKSLKSRQPSELVIVAGEDTSVWIFDLDRFSGRLNQHHAINTFVRRMAIQILLAAEEHSSLFKMYTPTERYRYIEKYNPQLLQRISLSQIASYLGVTRETLSRIRAKKV